MQVTLNITGTDFGPDVSKLLSSLDDEAKLQLSREIFRDFLVSGEQEAVERESFSKSVVADLRKTNIRVWADHGYIDVSSATEKTIQCSKEYRERMEKFKSLRTQVHERIVEMIAETCTARAKAWLASPEAEKIMAGTLDHVKSQLPSYMHDAVVTTFIKLAENMLTEIMRAHTVGIEAHRKLEMLQASIGKLNH